MSLKLGEVDKAISEYQAMMDDTSSLQPDQMAMLERKLAEALEVKRGGGGVVEAAGPASTSSVPTSTGDWGSAPQLDRRLGEPDVPREERASQGQDQAATRLQVGERPRQ